MKLGYGAGWSGELKAASGLAFEPNLELVLSLPPFVLGLAGGYAVQQLDYARGFRHSYSAPTATLTAGVSVTSWAALHVGAGALISGRLQVGTTDDAQQYGHVSAWGGRALVGADLAIFRGEVVGIGLKLDLAYSQTGSAAIANMPASMRFVTGLVELYGTAF